MKLVFGNAHGSVDVCKRFNSLKTFLMEFELQKTLFFYLRKVYTQLPFSLLEDAEYVISSFWYQPPYCKLEKGGAIPTIPKPNSICLSVLVWVCFSITFSFVLPVAYIRGIIQNPNLFVRKVTIDFF